MLYLVADNSSASAWDVRVDSITATDASVKVSNTVDVSAATNVPVTTQNTVATSTVYPVSTLVKPYSTVNTGIETAAGASTEYQAASAGQACISVALKAHPDNSSTLWVGETGLDGVTKVGGGYPLAAGDSISLRVSNVNLIYYSAQSANDRLCWIALT
jgi:hypothetical protein